MLSKKGVTLVIVLFVMTLVMTGTAAGQWDTPPGKCQVAYNALENWQEALDEAIANNDPMVWHYEYGVNYWTAFIAENCQPEMLPPGLRR